MFLVFDHCGTYFDALHKFSKSTTNLLDLLVALTVYFDLH